MAAPRTTQEKAQKLIGDPFAEALASEQPTDPTAEVDQRLPAGPEATNIGSAQHIPLDRLVEFENVREVSHNIEGLAESMRVDGLLQPIVVRVSAEDPDLYEIVCGHRRVEASRLLGWTEIPAIVRSGSDLECVEYAVAENIARESLTDDEVGRAVRRMIDMSDGQLTQVAVARRLGKDPSYISYVLRLTEMPAEIQTLVGEGRISMGHIRPLLRIANEGKQVALARKAADREVGVREFSEWVASELQEATAEVEQEFEVREWALAGTQLASHEYGEFPLALRWRFVLYAALKNFNDFRWMLPRGMHYNAVWEYVAGLDDAAVQEAVLDLGERYITNALSQFVHELPLQALLGQHEIRPERAIPEQAISHAEAAFEAETAARTLRSDADDGSPPGSAEE